MGFNDGLEKPTLALRSWGDVAALVACVLFIISGLVWGLKLESKIETLNFHIITARQELAVVAAQVKQGILPIAELRIRATEDQIKELQKQIMKEHSR